MSALQENSDFQTRGPSVFAASIVLICLSSIFVFCRLASRAFIVRRLSWDDYFMIVAWILAFGLCFSLCYAAAHGLGRHELDIPAQWQPRLREANYAFSILYQPALMASKTSILAFYLSLSKIDRVFRWACIITLFVVNAGGLSLTLVTVFQYSPISATFQTPTPAGTITTDILTVYLASIPLNLITDLTLLLLPMPILTRVRLPRKQKIILLVTFSFGIFVAAVDIVRIASLQNAARARVAQVQAMASNASSSATVDSSWYLSFSFLWSAVEVNVGIMCANVPGLKPLVARVFPSMLRDTGDYDSTVVSQPVRSDQLPDAEITHPAEVHQQSPETDGGMMDMMDFLTTPDMTDFDASRLNRMHTNRKASVAVVPPLGSRPFFDFVNTGTKKSLISLSVKESIFPISMVTILFFIWGFEYGLLNTLNQQFQSVASITWGQSTALHSAYYGGYFAGPILLGRPLLKHQGFKLCFPIGMVIYAAGLLIYWPAAVLTSWAAFLVTNIIVGFGLSLIEVAANPYIILCGPRQFADARLLLSQAVQAVGSVIAPLIANKAFAPRTAHAQSLVDTQWAYLSISLVTVLLAIVYFYTPLPDASDADLEALANQHPTSQPSTLHRIPTSHILLGLGIFALFCYVGGQEVNSTNLNAYLVHAGPHYDRTTYLAVARTAFAASRFLAAGLALFIPSQLLLLFFALGALLFEIFATSFSTGNTGIALYILIFAMEGPLFPLLYAQALHHDPRHTKSASVLLTSAIGGGAVFSPISSSLAANGRVAYALVVAVAAFAATLVYPLVLHVFPLAARRGSAADAPCSRFSSSPRLSVAESFALSFDSLRSRASRRLHVWGWGGGGKKAFVPPEPRVECIERVRG